MDRGAWWATVHGVTKSQTWLSDFTFTFPFHALEKEMATHSSVLAWRIPGTGDPGGLLPMGLHRVGHDWSDVAWQGTCHSKTGSIKDINGMDLTEAEYIKKRWQENTEKLHKKDLHDPDNHSGVITHLKPDILECEVKWALESITMNKASGGDGIPVELFQSWKMTLWKCCTQYASKFGKLSSGHRTGKGQFSFQFQRKAMPNNAQTTA